MVIALLDRIDYMQRVWKSLLPHISPPAPEDVGRWCNYSDRVVEQAILRTAKKFSASKIDPAFIDVKAAYRYTTGTARMIATQKGDAQQ